MSPKIAKEIKDKSTLIAQEFPGVTPKMRELVAYWKENCPQRIRRLTQHGILLDFARVLEQMARDRQLELERQNNPDAAAQAAMETYGDMMTPEDGSEEVPD